jgi:hypothetical protein
MTTVGGTIWFLVPMLLNWLVFWLSVLGMSDLSSITLEMKIGMVNSSVSWKPEGMLEQLVRQR